VEKKARAMYRPKTLFARIAMACLLSPLHLPLLILTELGATNDSPVVRAAKRYTIVVLGVVTYLDARLVAMMAPQQARYDVRAACVVSSSSARSRAVEVP
jgi:D-serine deaminase-like pyridoxal phosphate-dependent protein